MRETGAAGASGTGTAGANEIGAAGASETGAAGASRARTVVCLSAIGQCHVQKLKGRCVCGGEGEGVVKIEWDGAAGARGTNRLPPCYQLLQVQQAKVRGWESGTVVFSFTMLDSLLVERRTRDRKVASWAGVAG